MTRLVNIIMIAITTHHSHRPPLTATGIAKQLCRNDNQQNCCVSCDLSVEQVQVSLLPRGISPPWLSKQSLPLIVADAYFLCLLVSAFLERDWLSIVTLLVLKVLLFYALKFNINIMQIACSKKLIACQRVQWCSHSEHVNLNSLGKCNPL